MTLVVESPLLFIFHSVWSKCTLAHSWSKLRVQARAITGDQLAVGNSSIFRSLLTFDCILIIQHTALSQYLDQFNVFWSSLFSASHACTMWRTFLMVSVFLSAFYRVIIELHGKLLRCLIIPGISLAHSLICTGGILQCESHLICRIWLEDLRLEVKYKACQEMKFITSVESYFLSLMATLLCMFSRVAVLQCFRCCCCCWDCWMCWVVGREARSALNQQNVLKLLFKS